jgi:hypothetical protein
MIGGAKKTLITPDVILQRLTPYDIFKFYMPNKDWSINQSTHSPFRKDTNPSFIIGNRSGSLLFVDYVDLNTRGDCFTFVKMLFGMNSMDAVLSMIDKDFGLGLSGKSTNTGVYKVITAEYKQPEELGKRYTNIQVVPKKFTSEELAYWNEFHQDIQDLRDNNVFSLSKVYLNKQLFSFKPTELKFGYYYNGHWKIYRPHAEKKSKWLPNNVPISMMEGQGNLNKTQTAIITKSKKDLMVLKKIYPHVCAVQNEGAGCFTQENITFIKENSSRQILNFDSDIPGVTNSQQITKLYDFDYINVPREFLKEGINDYADLAKSKGLEFVKILLEKKGLYG